jgi:uncharacterized protein YpmB
MKLEWEKLQNPLSVTADIASILALFGVTIVATQDSGYTKGIIIIILSLLGLIIIAILLKLRRISGITESYSRLKHTSINDIVNAATNSVDILGISLRLIFEREDIDDVIIEKSKIVKFRFLIMNPDSDHFNESAEAEGAKPEKWKKDIEKTKERIKKIKRENPSNNIQIKTYNSKPIWKLVFRDDNFISVSFYIEKADSKKSREFIISQSDKPNLYIPLRKTFDELWDNSTEIDL